MIKKTCTHCQKSLPVDSFYRDWRGKYDVRAKCKGCFIKKSNESSRKTPEAFLGKCYSQMKYRVEGRTGGERNNRYYLGKELLPREQFMVFGLDSMKFRKLHKEYVQSGFQRELCPSVDRIDSTKGYVLNNVRWLTTKENCLLGGSKCQA